MSGRPPPRDQTRRRLAILVTILVVAAAVWGYVGLHLFRAATRTYALVSVLSDLRGRGLGNHAAVDEALPAIHEQVRLLRGDLAPFLAVSERIGWLPVVGPLAEAAAPLADSGEALLEVAVISWRGAGRPVLAAAQGEGQLQGALPRALAGMAGEQTALGDAVDRAVPALARLAAVNPARLPARLREPWAQAREGLPLLIASLEALPQLPASLLTPEESAYLLLAQNNDEIRATGGFISSIGTLRLAEGAITGFGFEDSYRIDNWSKPHDDPPEPLRKYMELDLLVTRDANWWPDFATSAQAVADLYASERDIPVEAVVAADVHAAARLLEALAPLELPGGGTLERGAVEEGLRQGWGLPDEALLTEGEVLTATAPFQAIEVAVRMTNKAGEAWIDEVTLERLGDPGANLVENGSFEEDADANGIPDGWTPNGLEPEDGLVDGVARDGERSLYMVGEAGQEKTLTQRLSVGGEAGDAFRLAAYSRTLGVEAKGGPYDLVVRLVPAEGEAPVDTLSAGFPCFTHEWASAGTAQVMLEWWSSRKDVIGLAAGAAASRLMGDPREVPWLDLLATARALLDERHIQIFARNPTLQSIIEHHGWGGALTPIPAGEDYLLVVDSNMGYNKVTASVSQTLDYVVSMEGDTPRARLTLTYANNSAPRSEECDKFKQYAPTYADMTQGCYWNYVRVYPPAGARLVSGSGGDEPIASVEEMGRPMFATYLVLAPGERREVVLEYTLPEETGAEGVYRLTVQKQGGTVAHPLRVTVRTASAGLPTSMPPATESSAGQVRFETDLRTDRVFQVDLD